MQGNIIRISVRHGAEAPKLADYEEARADISWEAPRRALEGRPGGRGLDIPHEAVGRYAAGSLVGERSPCGVSAQMVAHHVTGRLALDLRPGRMSIGARHTRAG